MHHAAAPLRRCRFARLTRPTGQAHAPLAAAGTNPHPDQPGGFRRVLCWAPRHGSQRRHPPRRFRPAWPMAIASHRWRLRQFRPAVLSSRRPGSPPPATPIRRTDVTAMRTVTGRAGSGAWRRCAVSSAMGIRWPSIMAAAEGAVLASLSPRRLEALRAVHRRRRRHRPPIRGRPARRLRVRHQGGGREAPAASFLSPEGAAGSAWLCVGDGRA